MNYATLSQAISDWLNKDNIDRVLPTIIRFGQRDLEDKLLVRAMEYTPVNADLPANTAYISLPADYVELKYLTLIKDNIRYPIEKRIDIKEMQSISISTTETGTPFEIARSGDLLYFDVKTDAIYTREWCYYRRLPTLVPETPNNTNWWSANADETLLMACLNKASLYITGIPEGDKKKWSDAYVTARESLRLKELSEQTSGAVMRTSPWQ